MKFLFVVLVVVLVFAVVAGLLSIKARRPGAAPKAGVYYLRKSLLSPAERSFLGVLDPLVPDGVRLFSKVRLEDVVGVKSGLERGERQAARNRINRKHVDFLLVRTSDLAPLAGIELDDSSHEEDERQERDAFVDSVFESAGLPLLHVAARKSYVSDEIRMKLSNLLEIQKSQQISR